MKQVITNTWCDAHAARDASEEVHAMTITVAVDSEGPLTLDLCADCVVEYVDPLRKLMATFGQPLSEQIAAAPKKRARRQPVAAAPAAPEKPKVRSAKASKASSKASGKASKNTATAAEIRVWASENGFVVPSRGVVPQDVREAFAASGGKA